MKSDISFVTDDPEYVKCYNQINQIILDNLGPVYKTNPVDYEQFLIGHGIFCKKDLGRVLKYQIVPLIQQYVAEGILTKSAKTAISQTASTYVPQAVVTPTSDTIIEDLPLGITPEIFKDQPRNNPKMPITNLLGRIVEQNLLPHEDIVSKILLNTNYFRTRQKNGQMASLIATKEQKEIFARADKSRSWYNGSCLHINGNEYWTKGGMQGGEIVYDKPYPFILEETTSPNVILNGIVLAYYEALISIAECDQNSEDAQDYVRYLKLELQSYRTKYLNILGERRKQHPLDYLNERERKKQESDYNTSANANIRGLISQLNVLWTNVGDTITTPDGAIITLRRLERNMAVDIYDEYLNAMESLNIHQMILQGPPGTSKTYTAKQLLKKLTGSQNDTQLSRYQVTNYESTNGFSPMKTEKGNVSCAWDIVQFHPSYSYEDFIRGIEVSTEDDHAVYRTVNKIMGKMAHLAKQCPETKFFLIVDEINRANLATVFGELIYGLEYRGESVQTPYTVDSTNKLEIPDNFYLIGTMNTADKSVGSIDYAIRRRFLFFEQLPDVSVIRNYNASDEKQKVINKQAATLFENIESVFTSDCLSPDYHHEDVQVGHTYFIVNSEKQLLNRFRYQIIPILKEYVRDGILIPDNAVDNSSKHIFDCVLGKVDLSDESNELRTIFEELSEKPPTD